MEGAAPGFVPWSAPHVVMVAATFLMPLGMAWLARANPRAAWVDVTFRYLWVMLLVGVLAMLLLLLWQGHREVPGSVSWTDVLPMHLCDWLMFIVIGALISRKRLLFELAYFWGLAGTLQAMVTPDLAYGFPHPRFFTFFVGHGAIIGAVLYLVFANGMRPRPRSILHAFVGLQVYMLAAGAANIMLGTNFGYLARPPTNPSLLDYLGPWPWYIGSLQLLAVLFFLILYLPWWGVDRWSGGKRGRR